jgi:pyridoxine 4-dehydrogenase
MPLTIAGTEVARIGLGTNRLTPTPENEAFLRAAVEAGLSHIDTAHVYTGGDSERAVGEVFSPAPDGLVVATKGGYGGGATPAELRRQIAQSLVSLKTGAIDLYYLHRVDPETPLEESLAVIAEFRDAGKIKDVGISAVGVDQIEAAREILPIAAVQNPYYPLKGDEPPALAEIAERRGATRSQIALAWLLRRSPVMLPIPGTRSIDHLRENLGAIEIELTDGEFAALGER